MQKVPLLDFSYEGAQDSSPPVRSYRTLAAERRDRAPARDEGTHVMFRPHPRTPTDYQERAAECERLAEGATAPTTRETMLYLANRWRAVANEDEARGQPREVVRAQSLCSRRHR
jgi:hypothetical protein